MIVYGIDNTTSLGSWNSNQKWKQNQKQPTSVDELITEQGIAEQFLVGIHPTPPQKKEIGKEE